MTLIVLKTSCKIGFYRDYKNLSNDNFIEEHNSIISVCDLGRIDLVTFEEVFMNIFNKHVPIKLKYVVLMMALS